MVVGFLFCFFFLSAFRTHLHSTFQNWSSAASCSSVFCVCIIFLCLSIKFLIQHTVCYWSERLKYAVLPWHTACQAGLLFSKLSWFYFERLGGKGGALGGVFFFFFFLSLLLHHDINTQVHFIVHLSASEFILWLERQYLMTSQLSLSVFLLTLPLISLNNIDNGN